MTCSSVGCDRELLALGLCRKHYSRFRRHGDANYTSRADNGAAREFLESIPDTDECVIWPFAKNTKGYGVMNPKSNSHGERAAHRAALRVHVGEPEAGQQALHGRCNNPSCVNPKHLRWGTPQDNMDDRQVDGTANKGERNTFAKLTDAQALEIYNSSDSTAVLALRYGLTAPSVRNIKRRHTWRHIHDEPTKQRGLIYASRRKTRRTARWPEERHTEPSHKIIDGAIGE